MIKKLTLIPLLFTGNIAFAQHVHGERDTVTETGQSAFAAISEITQMLVQDKDIDWSQVNITALRDHLVDMNNVTVHSISRMEDCESDVTFTVVGEAEVAGSIQRMLNAHAPMLQNETGWKVTVGNIENGAAMTIKTSKEELVKVKGLGFYGVMALGAHHQLHHRMIALGMDPH
jgi:hypothetical protein